MGSEQSERLERDRTRLERNRTNSRVVKNYEATVMPRRDERKTPQDFTNVELKQKLKQMGLATSGNKLELLSRITQADPMGAWMDEDDEIEQQDDYVEETTAEATGRNGGENQTNSPPVQVPQFDYAREIEIMRREQVLMTRELEIMRRENVMLRRSPPLLNIMKVMNEMLNRILILKRLES